MSANSADTMFPLNNLPYGVFSLGDGPRRLGVAIGDQIVDVAKLADVLPVDTDVLSDPRGWNGLMDLGVETWRAFRAALTAGADERDGWTLLLAIQCVVATAGVTGFGIAGFPNVAMLAHYGLYAFTSAGVRRATREAVEAPFEALARGARSLSSSPCEATSRPQRESFAR